MSSPAGSPPSLAPPGPVRRSRHTLGWVAGGLAVLLVAAVAVVSWLSPGDGTRSSAVGTPGSSHRTRATATPTAAAPTRQTPRPTSAPRRSDTASRTAPDRSLKTNSVYRIDLSGSSPCRARIRRARPPLRDAALAPYLRSLVDCLVGTFRSALDREGFTLTTPRVKVFKGRVKTPCGPIGQGTNPAFWCAGTIYWPASSDDGREAYTFPRLGYLALAAHEFGHHLQGATGITNGYGWAYSLANDKQRLLLSRRVELQADCFSGVFLAQTSRAIGLSAQDRRELRRWHSFTGDEDPPSSRKPDHGTSKAQVRWLERGLAGADLGRCNTWTASTRSVR